MSTPPPAASPEPTKASLIAQLLTVALVVVTGGGNWLANQKTAESNYDHIQAARNDTREDILKAVQEIHQIHGSVGEYVQRQKDIYDMLLKLTKASPSPPPIKSD